MKRATVYVTSFLAVAMSVAALGIGASMDMPRTLMSPVSYEQLKREIEADTRLLLGRCREGDTMARELCRAEARSAERVRKAELHASYYGTVAAQQEVRLARVRAAYDVARTRCGAQPGEARIDCLRAARAERERLLVES
jgi:hypothetical protein